MASLRRRGALHPERHVIVHDSMVVRGVLVGKTPLSPSAAAALSEQFRQKDDPLRPYGVSIFYYSAMGMSFSEPPRLEYAPGRRSEGPVSRYFAALEAGREQELLRGFPFDVSPVTDDRPFFFDLFRYHGVSALAYPHVRALSAVLLSVLGLALLLVLLPVVMSRFPIRGVPAAATLFFSAVGLAYLLVEVWLIHRFSMYLGHQAYSLAIVLSSLLLSTGAGAALGDRASPARGLRVALVATGIVLLLFLGKRVLPGLLEATASSSFALRATVTVAYTALLGVLMGRPFPAGLRWARVVVPDAVPWYIGINGFASVVATLAVIPLSHALGYEAVMLSGGALYVAAALVSLSMREAA